MRREPVVSRVYLSGPISGIDKQKVRESFARAELAAALTGLEVVNPTKVVVCEECREGVDVPYHEHTWSEWMKADIKALLTCDVIYMLDGWQDSQGARLEHYIAVTCGLRVIGRAVI